MTRRMSEDELYSKGGGRAREAEVPRHMLAGISRLPDQLGLASLEEEVEEEEEEDL